MIVLFSLLSSHFLTYDTFSTIANQIPDLVVMSVGMTFVLIIAGHRSVGGVGAGAGRVGGERGRAEVGLGAVAGGAARASPRRR